MLKVNLKDKIQLYQMIGGIVAVAAILIGCLIIIAPFFPALILSIIFALSAWPAFEWLNGKLKGRIVLSSFLMTTVLAACFVAPLVIIGTSAADNFGKTYEAIQSSLQGDTGQVGEWVGKIPVVGTKLSTEWAELTADKEKIKQIMQQYAGPVTQQLLRLGTTIGYGLLDLTLGVIFAYFLFRHGTKAASELRNLIDTFGGEKGQQLLAVSKATLIGVVYGILGTALAQGMLAAIGFWIANVPGATFLGLMTFFLSFIPMAPPLIWLPAALWLFSEGSIGMAIFLLVWGAVVISGIDNILKPYFISLGSNLPFMLVLVGIGGGVLAFGFIGIFIGPTILALSYSLIREWSGDAV